ncbi:MAG: PolC-type DNA polymerase III [Pyrinomonadaceae bacterium]
MPQYPNLISDSLLVNETISLLESTGGSASAVCVVNRVMNISSPPEELAKMLVSDLIDSDPRLRMVDDTVELITPENENRIFDETEFVVLDFETTGAKAPPCRVTEVGAYKVKNKEIIDEFQTLVNPETPIPEFIENLTKITDDMVKTAPKFSEIIDELLEFIGNAVLVAHNSPFDIGFLNYEVGRVYENYRVANPDLCTVRLSRKLIDGIENHRLATVANYYSIDLTNHHRAAADSLATAKIFINLLELLEERGISDLKGTRKFLKKKK